MVSPNLISYKKVTAILWSRGGYFFDWFIYAIRIVTTILSIISTMESISKSLISQALLSQISCKQDFYVIRGFRSTLPLRSLLNECHWHSATSVEGLTAYHSHVVPCLILSKGMVCGKDILFNGKRIKTTEVKSLFPLWIHKSRF